MPEAPLIPPVPFRSPPRWYIPVAAGLLVLAVVAVYHNSLDVPFLFDDGPGITGNATIRELWPLSGPLQPPLEGGGVTGRPLVNLSLAINYAWGGLEVRGYHATNVALHALAVLTLWGLLRRTLRGLPGERALGPLMPDARQAESVALGTALLWAVHPLLTESVVCVVQRNEVMGGLFMLLTLYAFSRAVSTAEAKKNGGRGWQGAAVVCCFLGMASKEIVATAPVVTFLYDRTFVAGSFSAAWRGRRGFYVALASTWLLLAWLMVGSSQRAGTVGLGLGVSSWDYLLTQCHALTLYVKLSLWPDPLVVDYGMVLVRSVREVWWQGLLVCSLLGATGWALGRRPALGFVGAWFFVILAPSSSVVPLVTQTIAEHRMYLPLAAVVVLFVTIVHHLVRRGGAVVVAALVVAAGCATYLRNEVYRDEQRLWTELIEQQPGNARAHINLGFYFSRQGDWVGALRHSTEAVRLMPDHPDARNGLGQALERTGRMAEALAEFELAHVLRPDDPRINFNLGSVLLQAGRLPEAVGYLKASLQSNPAQPEARNNLGLALSRQGQRAEAMEQFQAGLRLDPAHAELRGNLANGWFSAGQWEEAAAEYRRVLELRPDFAGVRHNLGVTLVRLGRPAEAIPHYEQALVHLPDLPQLHHNYAVALAQVGRVDDAIRHGETALQLNPDFSVAREHLAALRAR